MPARAMIAARVCTWTVLVLAFALVLGSGVVTAKARAQEAPHIEIGPPGSNRIETRVEPPPSIKIAPLTPGRLVESESAEGRKLQQDLRALREAGISHLLSLTEVPFPPAEAQVCGISCSALPMPDMHAPSLADGLALCRWLDRLLQAGHAVAVHCKAGLGRTGTVLAMYAIWHSPIVCDGSKSITKVRSLNAGMIQSVAQEAFLAQFAREVAQVRQSRSHASAD